MNIDRRSLLAGSLGIAAAAVTAKMTISRRYQVMRRRPRSRVAILKADGYSQALDQILRHGLDLFHLDVRGKSVLLKPNLVDYIPGNHIDTHPLVLGAAVECFRRLGAREVLVAEGPGHQRDTGLVLFESGFAGQLREQRVRFVDLNRDELVNRPLLANYTGMDHMWFPRTIFESDFIVSMPKVKAHHWSGVTLSMKNMFGVVPGAKYGWPKNILHWRGIQQSILDICATVPVHFVVADAVVAMEGDGPLNGTPRVLNQIILADDPVAADATCARLMGLDPEKIAHIRTGAEFLGNASADKIDQFAEPIRSPGTPFLMVREFAYLRSNRDPLSRP
ncbi:MAG: hypothetical protein JWO91_2038 [Acidobacteriaceae bacterium]|nr:hypothetical protein [Acidobacteriaceae bacterium]